MGRMHILLVLGTAICPLVTGTTLPTVNLGYEIHQATFNESGQYYNFSNIRYGAPPLGSLRFSAPTKPSAETPVFNDGSKAVTCFQAVPAWTRYTTAWLANGTAAFNISAGYQPPTLTTLPASDPTASEDCLFLDIMTPKHIFDRAGNGRGAPVMVWIHGGGYTLGSKKLYSPSAAGLLRQSQTNGKDEIIWVGLNYRLGAFGFLSGPTFQHQHGTSNAGLLDQRLALEWIQENIHKFGGDPHQVTIMGESAGGGSVTHQITAYGGKKAVPFQQAIVQSPGYQPEPSAEMQENVYRRFLSAAEVSNLDEARCLSTEQLQFVNYKLVWESPTYGTFTFNPAVDGSFAPALPATLLRSGRYDKTLRIMTGHNILEGLSFEDAFAQDEVRFEADLRIYFPTISDSAIEYISHVLYPPIFDGTYGYTTPTFRNEKFITETFFTCNTKWLASAYNNTVFSYLFSVPPSLHGQDVWYTYYNGPSASVENDTLAITMQEYFTNFVINHDPNGLGLPVFPRYGNQSTLLNLNLTSIDTIPDNVNATRCAWWQKGLFF